MSQHVHGTDNCRAASSRWPAHGQRRASPGTGLHPLRGQNNVQGASDAGLIPMVFPDYQPVDDARRAAKFEAAWGRELDPKPGLTVVEIMKAALEGRVKGMYMLGENPFLSDPNTNKVRKALSNLDFLVVQDIFLTETAEFADVVLPATSALEKTGTVHEHRPARAGRPAGAEAARRGAPRLADHLRHRDAHGLPDAVPLAPRRSSTRWSAADPRLRGPHPREPRRDRASSTRAPTRSTRTAPW